MFTVCSAKIVTVRVDRRDARARRASRARCDAREGRMNTRSGDIANRICAPRGVVSDGCWTRETRVTRVMPDRGD